MKKIVALIAACVLLITMAGCADKSANSEKTTDTPKLIEDVASLDTLQAEIAQAEKLMGVAYLGYIDYDQKFVAEEFLNQEPLSELAFLPHVGHVVENEGYRMFCIAPADDDVTITVYKCEFDDEYMPCAGEELVEAKGGAVIVRGSVSDTVPNIYVVARRGDLAVEYTPLLSGMDGRLENAENKIYDFTPYDKMSEFKGE